MNQLINIKSIIVLPFLLFFGCKNSNTTTDLKTNLNKDSAIGKIEWYDANTSSVIDTNTKIEVLGKGYNWAEGPLWLASEHKLIFSDVPENKIFEWQNGGTTRLYLTPSGYTGTAKAMGEIGSNGLALDRNNNLVLCQSGNRTIARMNTSINQPSASFTMLASTYNGKRFNSPNDVTVDNKNNIYFTDPIYGLPNGATDKSRELPFEGVYRISADGKLSLLIDSISRPNGIAFSPDEKTLYIASSDDVKPAWYAYKLSDDGKIMSGGVLLDAAPLKEAANVKQGPDGMKLNNEGTIFGAGPDGINIISPAGKRLGLIRVYNRKTSNCAFNTAKNTLYITADDVILRVKMK